MYKIEEIWLVLNTPLWMVIAVPALFVLCIVSPIIVIWPLRFIFHFVFNGFSIGRTLTAIKEADGWNSI